GRLTHQERTLLEENYRFLRKIEHRLQIMLDLQTHVLPEDPDELRKLAIRMGYVGTPHKPALEAFQSDYRQRTELNRKMLDHLLHDAFADEGDEQPEVDLVLDPEPDEEQIEEVMGRHGFQDVRGAYQNLTALGTERIRFLSTRRCRHFLAAIAPALLQEISATPDPDSTLVNLTRVSDSLGGKGVLWELFSFNRPTLRLYVELCASSPFLSSVLTSNPGMIDELMDSLVLDKLPEMQWLDATAAELCRGAEDVEPIDRRAWSTE
ncbi:MAG: bifunctional [glutamate--ammonia ligase]-adenylyl-L-tyrosine phosphorylase/[glutamate--ammonia-ligase] adenylyltransferase, partial [Chloroflexi bacterium]|nr:bifunctional [glutamate--ammonia ligase]-adenylyl-L-tyrosine phosphorylase/[glutamate--ammonia-ligase] adenylyltransferase [Chloroflexota bacterium]